MKSFFSEKNLVVILFILVLITFSLAQEDSRKMELVQPFSLFSSMNPGEEEPISNAGTFNTVEQKNHENSSR